MQSAYLLHMDPEVFPDPFAFQPQRWLDNPELKRNLFAFSRGSRSCLGMKYVYLYFIFLEKVRFADLRDVVWQRRNSTLRSHCFGGD
jgi:cytochrome P450